MLSVPALIEKGVFMATGYICAGTAVAILGGIPLWTEYLQSSFLIVSIVIIATALIAGAAGILLMHYLVRRIGAQHVFEQDILIYIIGMLFMALTINQAMFLVGLIITCAALPVFFYENFNRQLSVARQGMGKVLNLSGWALGPIVVFIALAFFSSYGLIVSRIIFAHFIVIGFWVWIQRLNTHENYADAPAVLLDNFSSLARHQGRKESAKTVESSEGESSQGEENIPPSPQEKV